MSSTETDPKLDELRRVLDGLSSPASFWWRDDDAGRPSPRLERLLALALQHQAPVGLAVVPAWLEPAAIAAIEVCPQATVLQHGWSHLDRSTDPARPCELVADALADRTCRLIDGGRQLLSAVFGTRFLPILVPPWNQLDAAIQASLPGLGMIGVSALPGVMPVPGGLPRIDAHVDLVHWPTRRWHRLRGIGLAAAAAGLVGQLAGGNHGPLGILSHHLVMDERQFADLDQLLELLRTHAKVRLLDPAAALAAL